MNIVPPGTLVFFSSLERDVPDLLSDTYAAPFPNRLRHRVVLLPFFGWRREPFYSPTNIAELYGAILHIGPEIPLLFGPSGNSPYDYIPLVSCSLVLLLAFAISGRRGHNFENLSREHLINSTEIFLPFFFDFHVPPLPGVDFSTCKLSFFRFTAARG